VRAAALAEARFGAGRGSRHFVYVTAGTGIAHTLVIDGRPMPGAHGAALILGAPPVERLASGRALAGDAGHVEQAGAALGQALAFLAHALDPERIVLGGGLGRDPAYRGAVEAGLRRWLEPPAHTAVPLVPARLGVDAGCIGAALYALGG
jgi:glucokinase